MPEPKETIGQRLKRIRADRRLSLEKASEITRVRPHYLQALEEDNYSVMSSAAQARGFLKLYADYLGLDLEAAMDELRNAESADAAPEPIAPEPALSTPEPAAPQAEPPASSSGTAVRRPFWARLLRRSAPEADATPAPAEYPQGEPAVEAPAPVIEPQPEPLAEADVKTTRVRKTPAKKPKPAAEKTAKPKAKSTSARAKKVDDKKKVSLKTK
ncbi:MAG: helix-turn-helix domain-containing protein [Chloroflexi bacterium]|nr:helix-turn-helix domain-containing protein [Chloroflexota bacterium]